MLKKTFKKQFYKCCDFILKCCKKFQFKKLQLCESCNCTIKSLGSFKKSLDLQSEKKITLKLFSNFM